MEQSLRLADWETQITTWDYDEAVERTKPKVFKWANAAMELYRELYIAREALSRRGGDRKREGQSLRTWSDFCEDIGYSRQAINAHLKNFVPAELSSNGVDEFVAPEKKQLPVIDNHRESRIVHAMETGERLAGWTAEDEKEFKKRKQNEHFTALAQKWGTKKIKTSWKGKDYFSEAMSNAKQYSRLALQSKEQSLAQFEIFEQISEYLRSFEDPNVRLSAAYNLGLRVRDVVNEMANMEAELHSFDEPIVDTDSYMGA